MRPGQSCPGVAFPSALSRSSPPWSFNEAGAIMPRSGRGKAYAPAGLGAASMRPGQSCPGVGISSPVLVVTAASMRPGQSCPGVACLMVRPGFNEANHASGRALGAPHPTLQ